MTDHDVRGIRHRRTGGRTAVSGRMSRETVSAKPARYLAEGRLIVTQVDGDLVAASRRGDGKVYELGHEPGRGWWCDCLVRTDRCAHLAGLMLVTVRRPARPGCGTP